MPQTVKQALRGLHDRFKHAGIDTPDLDARLLVMAANGFDRAALITRSGEHLLDDEESRLSGYAKRRLSGEPIDSILGFSEFYGRRFKISKDVLSPRPETEELVGRALDVLNSVDCPRVLDLGTGSGAILISILAERSDATGVGADKSTAALDIARQNSKTHKTIRRAKWIESDWYSHIDGQFDLIISNPPYITDEAMNSLSPEVANFDPDLALRGGEDGLSAYIAILAGAMDFLKPGGGILLEIGYDQGRSVPHIMRAAGFTEVKLFQDLSGHDRIVQGVHPKK